jgi:DNA-binding NarL/FixJ family response regulator
VTRVLVVATSSAVRAGLAVLLAGHPELTVLESGARPAALGQAPEMVEADVVLLALESGEEAPLPLRISHDLEPRIPAVVVLGNEPALGWASRVLRNGARGALPRTATVDQIVAAVLAAAAGLVVREPASINSAEHLPRSAVSISRFQPLTPREVEVIGMIAEGLGNKMIAARLGISEHTVKTHVTAVFTKLGVSSRAEAVASAARLGVIML